MSSFFDDASLVQIPSGYKVGTLFSIKPTDGTGDLTFTRSNDTATRVGPDSLSEKVRTNLVLQSQDFATTWGTSAGITLTSGQTDPFGGTDAFLVNFGTSLGNSISQSLSLVLGVPYTLSAYIKGVDLTGLRMIVADNSSVSVMSQVVNGTWVRVVLTGTAATTGSLTNQIVRSDNTLDQSFYIYGAQIETGDIATDYIATTTAAVSVGMTANVPRVDYSGGGCPKLLLEKQSTNLVTYSEQFDNAAWSTSDVTVTANTTISPSGYQDADTINATAEGQRINQTISVIANTQYTFSFYAKKGTMVTPRYSVYDLSNGALIIAQVDYSNLVNTSTWSRVTATFTTPSGCTSIFVYPINGASTGTIFLWGCQLEAGSYVSSYVPTIASSVTRLADAAYKTGISSLIGQTEGVVFIDFVWNQLTGTGSYPRIIEAWNNSSNYIQLFNVAGTSTVYYEISNGGAIQFSGNTTMNLGRNKLALAYKLNDCVFYKNGSLIASDTSATIPTTNDLGICGTYNGTAGAQLSASVNQAILFPTRLTNDQLADLTGGNITTFNALATLYGYTIL